MFSWQDKPIGKITLKLTTGDVILIDLEDDIYLFTAIVHQTDVFNDVLKDLRIAELFFLERLYPLQIKHLQLFRFVVQELVDLLELYLV